MQLNIAMWRRIVPSVLVAFALTGCSDDATPPEQQIRQLNSDAEAAAEAKDVGALKDMISADYRDVSGYDKSAIIRVVQLASSQMTVAPLSRA